MTALADTLGDTVDHQANLAAFTSKKEQVLYACRHLGADAVVKDVQAFLRENGVDSGKADRPYVSTLVGQWRKGNDNDESDSWEAGEPPATAAPSRIFAMVPGAQAATSAPGDEPEPEIPAAASTASRDERLPGGSDDEHPHDHDVTLEAAAPQDAEADHPADEDAVEAPSPPQDSYRVVPASPVIMGRPRPLMQPRNDHGGGEDEMPTGPIRRIPVVPARNSEMADDTAPTTTTDRHTLEHIHRAAAEHRRNGHPHPSAPTHPDSARTQTPLAAGPTSTPAPQNEHPYPATRDGHRADEPTQHPARTAAISPDAAGHTATAHAPLAPPAPDPQPAPELIDPTPAPKRTTTQTPSIPADRANAGQDAEATPVEKVNPWVSGACYAVAAATLPLSLNTSWRFFERVMHITDRLELIGMAAVMELALIVCGIGMAASVKQNGSPGAFRLVVWGICGFAGWTAWHMSDTLGESLARVILGPVLGAIMLHLALGLVRRNYHQRTSTLARLGRELRERALSRLGLADDNRTAAQRTRDRAATRAVALSLPSRWRFSRQARLQRALLASGVADDPQQMERMMARRKVAHRAYELSELDQGSPWD